MLTHVFYVELAREDAKRRRTAERTKLNPNPLSAADFDELLWPAHERYVASCIEPNSDRIFRLPAPSSDAEVSQNVQQIMQAIAPSIGE